MDAWIVKLTVAQTAIRTVPELDVVKTVHLALIAVKDVKDAPVDVAQDVLEIVMAAMVVKVAVKAFFGVNHLIGFLKFLNLIWKFQTLQQYLNLSVKK